MSIWNKDEIKRDIKILDKDIETDILIIGAGMTGMNTAYFLKDKKICVVDANKVGYGVTLNSTAKINYFQERIYTKIKNKKSEYLDSQIYSMNILKSIIEKEKINCDLKQVKSFVFANTKKEINPLIKQINFLKNNNINVKEEKLPINIKSYKSYSVDDTYIFNPIKYLNGLFNILKNKNIPIYENTKILKIEKENDFYISYTNNNKIKSKIIVLALHYPYFLFPLLLPLKTTIEKSYMIVSKVKKDYNFTAISSNKPTISIRYYNDGKNIYQISLAESHDIGFDYNYLKHFNKVKKIFNLKEEDIVDEYSNVDIMTPDSLPLIGRLKDNMYIGCGYNTWGMTNSVLASKIISDMILENNNKYSNLFNPNRFNIDNLIKMPYILFSQTKSFIGPKIIKNREWYKNNIYFNDNKAIYIDKNNKKHIVYNKCPHLGCSLIFNEKEKTWDCPCHSSRFDIDGRCIKGPSKYDITYKK